MQVFKRIFQEKFFSFFVVFFRRLYKRAKICYTVHMHGFTRLKNSITRYFYNRRKKNLSLFFPLPCIVCGVTHEDRQGALAQSKAGDKLQIVHNTQAKEKYKVYVYSVTLNRILGYLRLDVSKKLVKLFKKGFCKDGVLTARLDKSEKHPYYGCKIAVLESMDMMRDHEDFSHLYDK